MSDSRQTTPPQKSNNGLIFIVGGLVVAVGVVAYILTGGFASDGDDGAPAVTIENNTTAPAPAEPAAPAPEPAAPAEPAPAEPVAPAPAPAAPATP